MQLSTDSQKEIAPFSPTPGPEQRQRKRLILALLCLLGAICVVAVKNRAYLLTSQPNPAEYQAQSTSTEAPMTAQTANPAASLSPSAPANTAPESKTKRSKSAVSGKSAASSAGNSAADTYTPTVSRRALAPLDVEVYAGGRPIQLQPKAPNAIRVDTSNGTEGKAASSGAQMGVPGNPPAERVRISPEALQVLAHPVDPNYPLLAREMKVQGAVVLDALIGRDGTIQNLKIVSGPTILANAAMEAVRQWRFKPYFQEGQAVETEARITVNFTISTT